MLKPKAVRIELASLRECEQRAWDDLHETLAAYQRERSRLQKQCPHANLRLMRSGSKEHRAMCDKLGDESTECTDCGASGTSPELVGK